MDELDNASVDQLIATEREFKKQDSGRIAQMEWPKQESLDSLPVDQLKDLALKFRQHDEEQLAPFREEAARGQGAYTVSESPGAYIGRQFVSTLRSIPMNFAYGVAKDRLSRGEAEDSDLRAIAAYEHEQGIDQRQPEWAKTAGSVAGAAGSVGAVGLPILGPAVFAAQALTGASAQAGQAIWNPEVLLKGGATAAAQIGVLKALGPISSKLFPEAQGVLAQAGSHAVTGTAGLAVADYGTKLAGLSEHGGPIQDIIDGHYGDAARNLLSNAIMTGGLGAVEGLRAGYSRKASVEKAVEGVQSVAEQVTANPERRADAARRKAVSEMSPEEMQKELLTSKTVSLPNKRAFEEAGPAKAVGMSDADGLKAFNDKFGYEAGDSLLRAKAEALKAAGLEAFHDKGDEFLYRGGSPEEIRAKLERAREILKDSTIEVTLADGSVKRYKGADFSYGTGADLTSAESGLKAHKSEREARGERARGELRGIAELGPETSQVDQSRAGPGRNGTPPEQGAAVAPTLKTEPSEPHPEPVNASQPAPEAPGASNAKPSPTMSADQARAWITLRGLAVPESDAAAIAKATKLVAEAKAKGAIGVKRPTGEAPPEGPSIAEQVGAKSAEVNKGDWTQQRLDAAVRFARARGQATKGWSAKDIISFADAHGFAEFERGEKPAEQKRLDLEKQSPFPVHDKAPPYAASEIEPLWKDAPVRDVPLDQLTALQPWVNPGHAKKLAGESQAEPVRLVKVGDRYYIDDGMHRAVAAKLRGDATVRAKVVESPSEPAPRDPLADAYRNKGITKRDQRLHQAAIAGEDSLRSAARQEGLSPEGVRKAIKRVDEKLGQEFSVETMRAKEKSAREELHRGGVEAPGEEPAAKPRKPTEEEKRSKKLDDLGDLIMRQAEQGKLSPEAMARHKAEADRIAGVESLKEAKQAGIPPEHVEAMADDILAEHKESIRDWQSLYRDAYDALKEFGVTPQKLHGILTRAAKDPASIKGMDEVAQDLAEKYPSFFRLKTEHASDTLASILLKGKPQSMTVAEAREQAADRLAKKGVDGATKAALRSGDTQADVAESVRRGKEASDAELSAGQAEEGASEGGDFAFGAEPDPARVAALMKQGFNRSAAEERATLEAAKQQHPQQAMGAAALGELTHEAQAPEDPRLTALAHAQGDAEREALNLKPAPARGGYSQERVNAEAEAAIRADPQLPDKITAELEKKLRPLGAVETVVMERRKVLLNNELDRIRVLREAGDAIDQAEYRQQELDTLGKLERHMDLTDRAGSEAGGAFVLRQQLMAEDYSVVGMLRRATAAKGEPLTPEEQGQVQKVATKVAAATKAEQDAEAAFVSTGAKVPSPEFKEMQSAKVATKSAKGDFSEMVSGFKQKARTPGQKLSDWLIKARVNEVISGPTTLAKITAASLERVAFGPLEETAGLLWSKLPGIAKIAAMAPREGSGLSLAAEKRAIASSFTDGIKDAWRTIKTGQSELDVLHGAPREARSWLDYQFSLHDATKAPAVRNEYTRSFLKRLDFGSANKRDVTSPAALARIGLEAYSDGLRAKFRQENWLVEAYNKGINSLRTNPNPIASATGTGLRLLTPVVRIPTNLAFEVATHVFGAPLGAVEAIHARFVKGLENLKPAEADAIMRHFKKGSLGLAALAIGYANPQMFGGYYSGKRDEKDVKVGAVRLFGFEVPSWLLHNPFLEVFQVGATARRAADKLVGGKRQGETQGAIAAAAGLAEEVPLVREGTEIGHLMSHNARERGWFLGELAKSFVVPRFVEWLAGNLDKKTPFSPAEEPKKRKPEGVIQHIQTGLPVLREEVPAK